MAYEEYIRKAIQTGKRYEDLPEKVRAILPISEWRSKVRELSIQAGHSWDGSMARTVCGEQEYYEELVKQYKAWARLYPYHLAGYVARVLRITPFRYYSDVLFLMLRDERSYDRIPNFTAADALRVTGVGRNEYIAIMNACKAKKLLWRVNKGLARDLLPPSPKDVRLEGWWVVNVVNVGDGEFRELSPAEAGLLRAACESPCPLVCCYEPGLLQQLYRRGVIYFDIPVAPDDRFTLPPLEGFVSNKTSEAGDESVDPLEPLLYSLLVANSARLDQGRLGDILGVSVQQLALATSVAVRLGFASRVGGGGGGEEGAPRGAGLSQGVSQALLVPDSEDEPAPGSSSDGAAAAAAAASQGAWGGGAGCEGEAGAIAVVVDAEATSYLMMGALSPGLKRHSVTLFEGGRVGGAGVMDELIAELAASAAAGAGFEGDMVQLMRHIESLGVLLGVVRQAAAAQGQALELLRKESLAGLDPASAAKVLAHAYTSLLPIAPMPGLPLPLDPLSPGAPCYFGPTPEADSPWLSLLLYSAARAGPLSLVLPAGQRVWQLPPQLAGATHALLWGWWGGDGRSASDPQPLLVEGSGLLCTLNELLCRSAVMVQPLLHLQQQLPGDDSQLVSFLDVPLPLRPLPEQQQQQPQQQQQQQASRPGATAAAAGQAAAADDVGEALLLDVTAAAAAEHLGVSTPRSPASQEAKQQRQQQHKQPGAIMVAAVDRQSGRGRLRQLVLGRHIVGALEQLQLSSTVGWLRLVKLPPPAAAGVQGAAAGGAARPGDAEPQRGWLPLCVSLGAPLFCPTLCQQVCDNMVAAQCLTPAGQGAWRRAQAQLQQQLWALVSQYGAASSSSCGAGGTGGHQGLVPAAPLDEQQAGAGVVQLPACGILFDGNHLVPVEVGDCLQGARLW